jgi:hypothetical protein
VTLERIAKHAQQALSEAILPPRPFGEPHVHAVPDFSPTCHEGARRGTTLQPALALQFSQQTVSSLVAHAESIGQRTGREERLSGTMESIPQTRDELGFKKNDGSAAGTGHALSLSYRFLPQALLLF